MIYPYGRGSSTGDMWFLEVVRHDKAPCAIINITSEPIIIVGALLAKLLYNKIIPIVDNTKENPIKIIRTGNYVKVSVKANKGVIEVIK